jgi:hypothetical protein
MDHGRLTSTHVEVRDCAVQAPDASKQASDTSNKESGRQARGTGNAVRSPEVLVLSEAPDPVAGPGKVVVDVAVADVPFVDTQIRRG